MKLAAFSLSYYTSQNVINLTVKGTPTLSPSALHVCPTSWGVFFLPQSSSFCRYIIT